MTSKAKRKAVKKAQSKSWSPAARRKRAATWAAKRAARNAAASKEFKGKPIVDLEELPAAGVDIPLDAIPQRLIRSRPKQAKRAPYTSSGAGTVLKLGGYTITIHGATSVTFEKD